MTYRAPKGWGTRHNPIQARLVPAPSLRSNRALLPVSLPYAAEENVGQHTPSWQLRFGWMADLHQRGISKFWCYRGGLFNAPEECLLHKDSSSGLSQSI